MQRITDTNKWKDDWFLDLSPNGKLTFMFLCENCDDAGFYKLNTKHMHKYLKLLAQDIVLAVRELDEKLVFNTERKKIWIINFLFYQNQLPLEKINIDHKKIKLLLEKNLSQFDNHEDILYIINNQSSVKAKRVTKFNKPTQQEIDDFVIKYTDEEKFEVSEEISKSIFNHYNSNGWKVGKNPMKDWQSAVRNWLNRERKNNTPKNGGGKISALKEANSEVKDVTVEE